MKNLIVALTLAACALVASGTAQASLFPPYTQFIVANQLAPDAIPGDCFTVGTEPIALVHGNTACGGGGGGSNFPTGITTGVVGTDLTTEVGLATGAGAGGGYTNIGANSTVNCGNPWDDNASVFLLTNATVTGPILTVGDTTGAATFCGQASFDGPINASAIDFSDGANGTPTFLNIDFLGSSGNAGLSSNSSYDLQLGNGSLPTTFTVDPSGNTVAAGSVGFSTADTFPAVTLSSGAGPPSGACQSGSLYTDKNGTPGAFLYGCESSAWVAALSP